MSLLSDEPSPPGKLQAAEARAKWLELKIGMLEAEVVAILGKPFNAIQGSWIYPSAGSISFDDRGKVSAIYAL
jgi:hypothetical protein